MRMFDLELFKTIDFEASFMFVQVMFFVLPEGIISMFLVCPFKKDALLSEI